VSWIIENPSLIPWLPGRRKLSDAAKSWSCAISGRSPGSSFGEVFVSSMDECRASCESVKGCKAIVWRKSTGSCWRLDRFYETKYEEAFDDAQVANYGINQRCDDSAPIPAPAVPVAPVPATTVFGKIPECLDCHLNECNLWTMDQFNPESCRMCILTHCGGSENSQSTALPGLFLPGLLPNPDSDMLPFFPDTFPLPGRRELRNSVNDLTKASDASEDESLADKELSPSDTEVAPITRRLLRLILGQD